MEHNNVQQPTQLTAEERRRLKAMTQKLEDNKADSTDK